MPRTHPPGRLLQGRYWFGQLSWAVICVQLVMLLWVLAPALVLGWQPVVITGGSMTPGIQVGDVVLARPAQDAVPGDVVVFEEPTRDQLVTHRVVDITEDGRLRTQGDANGTPDSRAVPDEDLVGVGALLVPLVGRPAVWLSAGGYGSFAAWLLGIGVALWGLRYLDPEAAAAGTGCVPVPVWGIPSPSAPVRPRSQDQAPSPVRSQLPPQAQPRPESLSLPLPPPPAAPVGRREPSPDAPPVAAAQQLHWTVAAARGSSGPAALVARIRAAPPRVRTAAGSTGFR